MNTRNGNLVNLVMLALLMALIFLMGQTPLGLIPLGFCNVTLLVIVNTISRRLSDTSLW